MSNSNTQSNSKIEQADVTVSNKKRIIIHTGPGKTGSSAIQAWLTNNSKFLSAERVYYPKHPISKEQISSGNLRTILSQPSPDKRKNSNADWFVDGEKVKTLLADFDSSSCTLLLLSSEFFFHRMIEIQKLIPQAEFIAYIRNPVELLESNYNQAVKRHGKLEKFSAPQSLDKYFWQYLTKACNAVGTECMHLRPYDETLMVGHNIVSDLLAVLGIDKTVENKRINPSFTFASLEFKRLLNHFELGPLEPRVDNALQSCNLGSASYSLMAPEDFERLNKQSCQQMQLFINKFDQSHLTSLLDNFSNAKQRLYHKQEANIKQLSAITEYLHNKVQPLYFQLKDLVALHNNLKIDNNIIYQAFDVPVINDATVDDKNSEIVEEELLQCINNLDSDGNKHGKIAFELSCYFAKKSHWTNAVSFAQAAYFYNPNQRAFKLQLNKVLIQKNLQFSQQNTVQSKYSVKSSIKGSVKGIAKASVKRIIKFFLGLFKRPSL